MKVLAVVEEASTARACLSAAAAIGSRLPLSASVVALHIVVDMAHAVTSGEEVAMQHLLEVTQGTALERASATREAFSAWLAEDTAKGPAVRWKEITDGVGKGLARESRDMDLLVLAKPCKVEGRHALRAAFFVCARPILLVPEHCSPAGESLGVHIAIAWNNTLACRRAAVGAQPWLRQADHVTIIMIGQGAENAGDVVGLLCANGVVPSFRRVARSPAKLGQQIVDEAQAIGADLLVAGAYRHGTVFEWLAGRTTRQMLRRADMPLFLAH